jgi:PAS domain S-box-containing protein
MEYNKHKFQEILNVTPDGILVLDPSGNVMLVNQAAENYLDIEAKNIVGKPLHKAIEYLDLKQLSGGSEKKYVDIKIEGGQIGKTLRFSLQPIRPSDPHSGQVMMIRDMTEQVMADQAREEFIAHAAHELKTPLNTLKSYSEMLMDGEASDEETKKEFYNTINEEADRLSGLIGNLLNITQIELGCLLIQKTRVKTGDLLEDILEIADRQKKGKNISIYRELPDKLPVIKADKELLRVALLNLLSNAVKYTDEGKGITLKAEEDGGVFMIHVIDAGVGISPEDMPHIFEKFYRSKDKKIRQRTGHGLGLYLSRQIVQLHGGDIRVISHPGEGSQFTVILKIEEDILG